MAGVLAEINIAIRHKKATATMEKLRKIISTLNLFPVIIIIAWGPACASDTIYEMFNRYNSPFGVVSTICACSQGLLTAMLFWSRNSEVRKLAPFILKTNAPIGPERELRSRGSGMASSQSISEDPQSSSYWSSLSGQISLQFNSLRSILKVDPSLRSNREIATVTSSASTAAVNSAPKYMPSAESRSTISVPRSSAMTGNAPVEEAKSVRSYDAVQEFQKKEILEPKASLNILICDEP